MGPGGSRIVGHHARRSLRSPRETVMPVMTNVYGVYPVQGAPLPEPHEISTTSVPTLQVPKLRLREAELHPRGHTAVSGGAAQDS